MMRCTGPRMPGRTEQGSIVTSQRDRERGMKVKAYISSVEVVFLVGCEKGGPLVQSIPLLFWVTQVTQSQQGGTPFQQ